jgi:hypothetical protein
MSQGSIVANASLKSASSIQLIPMERIVVPKGYMQTTALAAMKSVSRIMLIWIVVVTAAAMLFCLGGLIDYLIYSAGV